MAFGAAQVQLFANAGPRIEHLDSSGGGTITRVFYCQPYIAYPWIELFLKGTVVNNGSGVFARVKPHADPMKPWFYCSDVQVHPFAPETVTGQAHAVFTPNSDTSYNAAGTGGQQAQVGNVLNGVDDHGMTNILDFGTSPPLTIAQIKQGGSVGLDTGKCGAFIVATYTPLIFLDGTLPSGTDPFDFVNPTWTPVELSTQSGRNLFFYSPSATLTSTALFLNGGILDTFSKPEVIWEFSITRKMVPFLPSLTMGVLNEKLNSVNSNLGNVGIPLLTARFVCPEPPPLLRAPDGATYYEITYKYRIRKLYDEYFDDIAFTASPGAYPAGYKKGWIDWNHHFGIPSARLWPNESNGKASYYPVCWNGGLFQLFGANHPLYLQDQSLSGLSPAPVPGIGSFQLLATEFQVGFKAGQ